MKKLLALVCAIYMVAGSVFAEKGDLIFTGKIAFDYSGAEKIGGNKSGKSEINFEIGPTLLYGFNNFFYLGAELSANMYNFKDFEAGEEVRSGYKNLFGISPTIRLYIYKNQIIGIFSDNRVGFFLGRDDEKTTYTVVRAGVTPGIEIFIGPCFSMSMALNNLVSLDYQHASPKGDAPSYDKTEFGFIFNPVEMNYAPLTLSVNFHF